MAKALSEQLYFKEDDGRWFFIWEVEKERALWDGEEYPCISFAFDR